MFLLGLFMMYISWKGDFRFVSLIKFILLDGKN